MINIDELIVQSMKDKNSTATNVYKLVKSEFIRWTKDNPGKEFGEAVEEKIIKKLNKQWNESLEMAKLSHREDLVKNITAEIAYLTPFLPEEISEDKIIEYTEFIINEYTSPITMKDMKSILTQVQAKYPSASGKIVSSVVKSYCS